jgi:hypothetical protein
MPLLMNGKNKRKNNKITAKFAKYFHKERKAEPDTDFFANSA